MSDGLVAAILVLGLGVTVVRRECHVEIVTVV